MGAHAEGKLVPTGSFRVRGLAKAEQETLAAAAKASPHVVSVGARFWMNLEVLGVTANMTSGNKEHQTLRAYINTFLAHSGKDFGAVTPKALRNVLLDLIDRKVLSAIVIAGTPSTFIRVPVHSPRRDAIVVLALKAHFESTRPTRKLLFIRQKKTDRRQCAAWSAAAKPLVDSHGFVLDSGGLPTRRLEFLITQVKRGEISTLLYCGALSKHHLSRLEGNARRQRVEIHILRSPGELTTHTTSLLPRVEYS
jgi:hypothetical protein